MLRRHAACHLSLLAALADAPATAATSEQTFKGITDVLYPSWHKWTNRCAKPSYPASLVADSAADTYHKEMDRYERCLTVTLNVAKDRTEAEPLVNPSVWADLSEAQKSALNAELLKANRDITDRVIQAYRLEEAEASDALKEREEALVAAAAKVEKDRLAEESSNRDAFRSCARRAERAYETSDNLDSELASLKSDELQLGMQETRLIGMRLTASALDYNNAVNHYNYNATQLSNRANRYNKKVEAANANKADIASDCLHMKVSGRVFKEVCDGGDYRRFCSRVRSAD